MFLRERGRKSTGKLPVPQGFQRDRVVKLTLAAGTTQACNGGQPGSVGGIRHRGAVAGESWAGEPTPLGGPAETGVPGPRGGGPEWEIASSGAGPGAPQLHPPSVPGS